MIQRCPCCAEPIGGRCLRCVEPASSRFHLAAVRPFASAVLHGIGLVAVVGAFLFVLPALFGGL